MGLRYLRPNGDTREPVRPEPVEGLVPEQHCDEGFDRLSPNGPRTVRPEVSKGSPWGFDTSGRTEIRESPFALSLSKGSYRSSIATRASTGSARTVQDPFALRYRRVRHGASIPQPERRYGRARSP